MGKVVYEDPIHHISGKISKKFRTCYNYRKASERKYTSVRGERTSPLTQKEINNRTKFKTVRLAALERSLSLSTLTSDQAKFEQEKKQSGFKYTTYKGWLFGKAWQYYDKDNNTVNWPASL